MDPLAVRSDRLLVSGSPFTVWGFNYDRDRQMRLLEEYWEQEWDKVVSDLRLMRDAGANLVRVHLQTAAFLEPDGDLKVDARARLVRLVDEAESLGLFLDLTGLSSYRGAAAQPHWLDEVSESDRWELQARFWSGIAEAVRGRSGVAFIDLMNEPAVPRKPVDGWYFGELGPFWYCQHLTRNLGDRDPDQVASGWTSQMVDAVKSSDPDRLVTIGLLPESKKAGVDPAVVSRYLDLVAVHIYPRSGSMDESVALAAALSELGKPVVIEEMFPIHCSLEEIEGFIEDTSPLVSGWVGFHWGAEPEGRASDNQSLILRWLEMFGRLGPQMKARV